MFSVELKEEISQMLRDMLNSDHTFVQLHFEYSISGFSIITIKNFELQGSNLEEKIKNLIEDFLSYRRRNETS